MKEKVETIPTQQIVQFQLGKESFGVDILQTLEIVRFEPVAQVPETPEFVEGVMNLRGNVIPVINLRKKFGLKIQRPDDQTRIVIFELDDKMIGAIVDQVDQIIQIPEDRIESSPELAATEIQPYIWGVGKTDKELIILLDIRKVLSENEIIQLKKLDALKHAVMEREASKNDKENNQKASKKPSPKVKKKRPSKKVEK